MVPQVTAFRYHQVVGIVLLFFAKLGNGVVLLLVGIGNKEIAVR